jgi:hypothetical protein
VCKEGGKQKLPHPVSPLGVTYPTKGWEGPLMSTQSVESAALAVCFYVHLVRSTPFGVALASPTFALRGSWRGGTDVGAP